jgi:hypothetical protein
MGQTMKNSASKLTARDAIARTYSPWDRTRADRLIAWLDQCGYVITEKGRVHDDATLVPAEEQASAHHSTHI